MRNRRKQGWILVGKKGNPQGQFHETFLLCQWCSIAHVRLCPTSVHAAIDVKITPHTRAHLKGRLTFINCALLITYLSTLFVISINNYVSAPPASLPKSIDASIALRKSSNKTFPSPLVSRNLKTSLPCTSPSKMLSKSASVK